MAQTDTGTMRNIGEAWKRYMSTEEYEKRHRIANALRKMSDWNSSALNLVNWEDHIKRSRLAKNQANRFDACGSEYIRVKCRDCNQYYIGRKRCEVRICESCSRKYAIKTVEKQTAVFEAIPKRNKYRPMLLTLTLKSNPVYRPTAVDIKRLYKHTRKLINFFWPKRHNTGGFTTLEVGENFNLHIHALIYGQYVPQWAISEYWHKLTGDSMIVHIREAKKPHAAIGYILKYITKPLKRADPEEIAYLCYVLAGTRRIRTYGIFYNFKVPGKQPTVCIVCGGRFKFDGFFEGPFVEADALLFEEIGELLKNQMA